MLGLEDDPLLLGFCSFSGVNWLLFFFFLGGYWGKSSGNENPIIGPHQNPGWLGYIGDYTIQLYGKANIRIPINQ